MPESFKVLIKELQSLALDIKVLGEDKQEIEIKELDDEDEDMDDGLPARDLAGDGLDGEDGAAGAEDGAESDDDISLDDELDNLELDDGLDVDIRLDDDQDDDIRLDDDDLE